jgi:hypothetical protein
MTYMCGFLVGDLFGKIVPPVETQHLKLVPATKELVEAELKGGAALAKALGVNTPGVWPPKHVPAPGTPDPAAWWNWYFVTRPSGGSKPQLVGVGAIKGWSSGTKEVQMGCAVLDEHKANGYASEAFHAMAEWAFSQAVDRVVTDVPVGHAVSLKILARLGFLEAGAGADKTLARYERCKVKSAVA